MGQARAIHVEMRMNEDIVVSSKKQRAFITGGSGYVGGRLVDTLLEQGWEVNALIHKSHGDLDKKPVHTVRGSIFDKEALLNGMKRCNCVFHIAAMVSFARSDCKKLMETNCDGTRLVLQCALESGITNTVVTSSACTLGVHPKPVPVDEKIFCKQEWRDRNVYLNSKRAQEEICIEFHEKGLCVVIVNPTTIFGPGDRKMNSGVFFKQVTNFPVVFVPPGGTSIVDIDDIALGHVAALRHGKSGNRYVLTTKNLTFKEIYSSISKYTKSKTRLAVVPTWTWPILKTVARSYCFLQRLKGKEEWQLTPQIVEETFAYKWYSSEKARKELGWEPLYSFEDSIQRSFEFYRKKGLL